MEILLLIGFCFVTWALLKFRSWFGELTAGQSLSDHPSEQPQNERLARKLTTIELAKELFEEFPASGRSSTYVLVRESHNPHDKNAIAVYGHGRKVGYVSQGKAASLAPLLDELGSQGFSVSGTAHDLRMNLPRIPILREFVENFRP